MKKQIIVGLLIGLLLSGMLSAITVEKIIEENLKIKGGKDKILAIKNMHFVGKMAMMGMEMKMEMWFKKPDNMRMNIFMSEKKMTFGYDGKTVWQISPFTGMGEKAQEVTGTQAEDMKDNADSMDDLFVNYKEKGTKIELVGKEEMEGTPVYKLKITKKNKKELYYYLDAETFIELKSVSSKIINGQEMKYESVMSDYRSVNGVMMPFQISSTSSQGKMNIIIEKMEANIKLEPGFFKMPESKEVKK